MIYDNTKDNRVQVDPPIPEPFVDIELGNSSINSSNSNNNNNSNNHSLGSSLKDTGGGEIKNNNREKKLNSNVPVHHHVNIRNDSMGSSGISSLTNSVEEVPVTHKNTVNSSNSSKEMHSSDYSSGIRLSRKERRNLKKKSNNTNKSVNISSNDSNNSHAGSLLSLDNKDKSSRNSINSNNNSHASSLLSLDHNKDRSSRNRSSDNSNNKSQSSQISQLMLRSWSSGNSSYQPPPHVQAREDAALWDKFAPRNLSWPSLNGELPKYKDDW